jgi:SAM-dependent methyltransferase
LGHAAPAKHAGHDRFDIVECRRCGLSFSDPLPTDEDLRAFYEAENAYFDVFGRTDFEWKRRQDRLDLLRVARQRGGQLGKLLDVGCSYGLLLEVAAELGWEVYGVEPSERACDVARARAGVTAVFHGYVHQIPADWGPFDAVSMSHVFEHLVDFRSTLNQLAVRLARGGVLAIQCPNRRAVTLLRDGPDYRPIEHPYYWTYPALFVELRRAGLTPKVAPPLWRGSVTRGPAQVLKEVALAIEGWCAGRTMYGIKSTLEVHGIKP